MTDTWPVIFGVVLVRSDDCTHPPMLLTIRFFVPREDFRGKKKTPTLMVRPLRLYSRMIETQRAQRTLRKREKKSPDSSPALSQRSLRFYSCDLNSRSAEVGFRPAHRSPRTTAAAAPAGEGTRESPRLFSFVVPTLQLGCGSPALGDSAIIRLLVRMVSIGGTRYRYTSRGRD